VHGRTDSSLRNCRFFSFGIPFTTLDGQAGCHGKVGSLPHGFLPASPAGPPAWVRFDADVLQRWGMTEGHSQECGCHHACIKSVGSKPS